MSIINEKFCLNDWIVEMVVWQLPEPVLGSEHCYKYRLYCGRHGVCRLRYDNERGKGDHVHDGEFERDYEFIDYTTLIADFRHDVQRIMREEQ